MATNVKQIFSISDDNDHTQHVFCASRDCGDPRAFGKRSWSAWSVDLDRGAFDKLLREDSVFIYRRSSSADGRARCSVEGHLPASRERRRSPQGLRVRELAQRRTARHSRLFAFRRRRGDEQVQELHELCFETTLHDRLRRFHRLSLRILRARVLFQVLGKIWRYRIVQTVS